MVDGAGGAIEAGVALAAAEKAVELDDVGRADRIGIGIDEEHRHLESGDLSRPVVVLAQEGAKLGEELAPIDMSNGIPLNRHKESRHFDYLAHWLTIEGRTLGDTDDYGRN